MTIKRLPKRQDIANWTDENGRLKPWAWANDTAPLDARVRWLVQALEQAGRQGLGLYEDIHPPTLGNAGYNRAFKALYETLEPRAVQIGGPIQGRVYLKRFAPDSAIGAKPKSLADRVRAATKIMSALQAELAAIAEAFDAAAARPPEAG